MRSVNQVTILGYVGRDPDVRAVVDTMVATVSVATTEKWKDKGGTLQESTTWHRVVAWGAFAKLLQSYVKKGDPLMVQGKIVTREWDDAGTRRWSTEIVARDIVLLSQRRDIALAEPEPEAGPPVSAADMPF